MDLIKNLIIYASPFLLIYLYVKIAYGVGPWWLIWWWGKNWRRQHHIGMVIVFTLLAILFAAMVTSGALYRGHLAVAGEDQELVYLGNPRKGISQYLPADDLNAVPLEAMGGDHNTSFNAIYRTEIFRNDRDLYTAGVRVSDFHVTHLIANMLMSMAVYIFLICMLHIVAYPVSKAAAGEKVDMASMDNLDEFLKRWNLNRWKLSALFFGGMPLAMIFMLFAPASSMGDRVIPLPESIVPGSELLAIPVSIHIEQERYRRGSNDEQVRYRDSGYRNVVYHFTEDFEIPVYVTARYHKSHYPALYDEMKENIKERRVLSVEIQEDLTIRPLQ